MAAEDVTRRLGVLVGRWRTEGWTRGDPGERIDATDTYEWLPGGFALLHTVDARVGAQKVEGAEIIGYDPERDTYVTLYFGSDGPTAYEAGLSEEGGALAWSMRSASTRFRGTFNAEEDTITGQWELLHEDDGWQPWMDITLRKLPD